MKIDRKELSYNINHALLQFSRISPENIYQRVEWLWRSAIYLLAGIRAVYPTVDASRKETADVFQRTIEKEVLPELEKIMKDQTLAKAVVRGTRTGFSNPSDVLLLNHYNIRLNNLRDKISVISVLSGFEHFTKFIGRGEE